MTSTTEITVETLAAEASSWFEAGITREGEDQPIRRLKDGRPEWVYELVREAHGDFFPDDWRYNCIENALDAISDGADDPGEFADEEVDVYNGARVAWLASSIHRGAYCDEAASEFGGPSENNGIYGMIGLGQYMEASEVFGLVMDQLEARLAEIESEAV